jgi:serine/threonine-protein kinase
MFLISGGFWLFNVIVELAFFPETRSLRHVFDVARDFHLLASLIACAEWLVCRRGGRTPAQLNAIDVGALLSTMIAFTLFGAWKGGGALTTMVLMLITFITVVTRAIVVPGTARRTLWLSYAACMPPLVGVCWLATKAPGAPEWNPWTLVLSSVAWLVAIVAIATFASRIIYGLQQRVRKASQLGQYTLLKKIGEGGMGAVYLARHALLRRPTAVKLLPRARAGEHAVRRFEREVQLTSALTHPNTIAIYDYGHTPDGVFYYAMELLEGLTLEDVVASDGPMPASRVVHVLRQACSALAEAHEVGLIHRDVKPANLMLCVRGGVYDHLKVLDFGLVKEVDRGDAPDASQAAVLVGTPLYLAPEAISAPGDVDARADLYALGCVAYQLLTGAPPFSGGTVIEVCGRHLHVKPDAPSTKLDRAIPASLEQLVMDLLEKDPAVRPASAAVVLERLEAAGIEPWTATDAKVWWNDRAPAISACLLAAKKGAKTRGATPHSVTIDLGDREPAAVDAA